MGSLRHFLRGHPGIVWATVALIVGGVAILAVETASGLRMVICTGMGPMTTNMAMPGAMPGTADHPQGDHDSPAKHDTPCAGAGLHAPSLGGADVVQLVLALAVIFAAGVAAVAVVQLPRVTHLRPPLRGPPAIA
ncbi:MAG: hypothetical protein M3R41_06045 [Pseudomonadota bacterium]|nr:hypothetical protein [Pseudomonadota bacterium]